MLPGAGLREHLGEVSEHRKIMSYCQALGTLDRRSPVCIGATRGFHGREEGGNYMGRKGEVWRTILQNCLMDYAPPERASPGFGLLLSIMESGVLLSSQWEEGRFLDTRVRRILDGIPAIPVCLGPALPFLGGSISWSRNWPAPLFEQWRRKGTAVPRDILEARAKTPVTGILLSLDVKTCDYCAPGQALTLLPR